MGLNNISISFLPKYQLLLGLNIIMHETFDMKTESEYDGIDIEFGVGILLLTITVLKKKKGATQ
jgi:hypothetical protein